jgi:hypothetical protein
MHAALGDLATATANLRAAIARHREMILSDRAYETAWAWWALGWPIPDDLRELI